MNDVSGRKVLLFREAPRILYTGLSHRIGNPHEYEKNIKEGNSQVSAGDISIPLEETNEYVAVQKENKMQSPVANKNTAATIKDKSAASNFSDIKNTEKEQEKKHSETKINSPKGIVNSAVNKAVYGKPGNQWGNAED